MGNDNIFSERLRVARKEKKMSQRKLCEKVEVSKSSLCAYETGVSYPPADAIQRLCRVLDVSADYLLGLDDTHRISIEGLTDYEVQIVNDIISTMRIIKE